MQKLEESDQSLSELVRNHFKHVTIEMRNRRVKTRKPATAVVLNKATHCKNAELETQFATFVPYADIFRASAAQNE